jgi:DUF971 family protein
MSYLKQEKIPTEIVVNQKESCLELSFSEGKSGKLSFEFLRVHSPSAEVVGHGKGQEVVQVGKKNTKILILEPIGNYGVKPKFSDGHDTGIYSWSYLNWLLDNKHLLWDKYLKNLEDIGASRDQD